MLSKNKTSWLNSALFWRTFLMVGFLIVVSLAAWITIFRFSEHTPHVNRTASRMASAVTLTRAALAHADQELQHELLFDLARNEGIRVYVLEKTDKVTPFYSGKLMDDVAIKIKELLGKNTRLAASVNDVDGVWISFELVKGDEYWVMLEKGQIRTVSNVIWAQWSAAVLLLSLIGAAAISRKISAPLSKLAFAARTLAQGKKPDALPEIGSTEVIEANHSFNQMVNDLEQADADRALMLAGISHDLRTPLARMQLEIEMANLSETERSGMRDDIEMMDQIIGQFLDYARQNLSDQFEIIDVSALLNDLVRTSQRWPEVQLDAEISPDLYINGHHTALRRIFDNLIENARRYGKTPHADIVEIQLLASIKNQRLVIQLSDSGVGIPKENIEHMLRPFTRLDQARGQASGSGLGLAIVQRVIQQHGGQLLVENKATSGLSITLTLPASQA